METLNQFRIYAEEYLSDKADKVEIQHIRISLYMGVPVFEVFAWLDDKRCYGMANNQKQAVERCYTEKSLYNKNMEKHEVSV